MDWLNVCMPSSTPVSTAAGSTVPDLVLDSPNFRPECIGVEPPQLAADLEAAGKEAGVEIPETVDRPPSPAGKRYLEHSLDVKLRKVGLKELATFLSKVETNPRLIAITRLQIRHSFGEGDKLDVEATATAYERLKEERRKKSPGKGKD